LAMASFIIHYLGWQAERALQSLVRNGGRIAQVDCRHEMNPMAFLDPGAFVGTKPASEKTIEQ